MVSYTFVLSACRDDVDMSRNAGLTKFISKLGLGVQQILRLLQLNLFERCDLMALLRGDPPKPINSPL